MAVTLLIVGVKPGPSGKTEVALILLSALERIGLKPAFIKPFSAVNWYENYDLFLKWRDLGKPFSKEYLILREAFDFREDPSILNPVCAVASPLKIEYFLDSGSPEQLFRYEGDFGRSVVLTRITFLREKSFLDYYLVNAKIVKREISLLKQEDISRLTRSASKISEIWGFNDYADSVMMNSALAIKESLSLLVRQQVAVIIEGYGNLAMPVPGLRKVDLIVAVYPGYALFYEPKRYVSAVYVKERVVKGMNAVTVEDIFNLVNPTAKVRLSPHIPGESLETLVRRNAELAETAITILEKKETGEIS